MEKATLQVRKTKKGLAVTLMFEDGKSMPFPRKLLQDLDLDNTPVLVQREKGQPVLITRENGQVLFDSQPPVSSGQGGSPERKRNQAMLLDHVRQVKNPASAPYNFVPLNKTVVTVPESCPRENKYFTENNRYTGWIDLRIEALTPLYIRDTLTREEVQQGKKSNEKPEFFSPAGICRIPGSSLRGMVRTLVEIVSYGRLHFVDTDQRLYYRALADQSNLRAEYQKVMSSYDRNNRKTQYKCLAGVLVKDHAAGRGEKFYIRSSGENFHQVLKDEVKAQYKKAGKKYQEFTYLKLEEGYLVVSGDMPGKKRDWFIHEPAKNAEEIPLLDQDVRDYLNDTTRGKGVPDLIQEAREKREGVPCFYSLRQDEEKQQRISFGHTAMFRLAYEKTIGEHIPSWLQGPKPGETPTLDFAGEIFGNTSSHAGRVFFEDAVLQQDCSQQQMAVKTPHILSTPKPTTFQHYLVQTSEDTRKLQHYNSNSAIRGHKMYWHKSGERWEQEDQQEIDNHPSQYTKIRPVKAGSQFSGRIRFENLSSEELGALLFVLDLPEGCAHKLGMGKPLGLGSIKITASLRQADRLARYQDLFMQWDRTPYPEAQDKIQEYQSTFNQYILDHIPGKQAESLWELDRMQELRAMLNFSLGKKLERVGDSRYMAISPTNEFKYRKILPSATGISAKYWALSNPIQFIKQIEVIGLWDKYNIDWKLDREVSVLGGINGSGKTTLLSLVVNALRETLDKEKQIPRQIKITFDNDEILWYMGTECIDKPQDLPRVDLVSTFDTVFLDYGPEQKQKKSSREVFESELTIKLEEVINIFSSELKKAHENKIDVGINIKNLVDVCDDLFSLSKKYFELTKSDYSFSKKMQESIWYENTIPNHLLEKIFFENNSSNLNGEEKEFHNHLSNFIEHLASKIGMHNAYKYAPIILKHMEFYGTDNTYFLFRLEDEKKILPCYLSSGEKQMLIILYSSLIARLRYERTQKHTILFLDEPENSLHLGWQRKLIARIKKLDGSSQIIITSHGPAIIQEGYIRNTREMSQIKKTTI